MALEVAGRVIDRIRIVDDDPDVREQYAEAVADLDVEALPMDGPLPELDQLVNEWSEQHAQAAICDYRLQVRQYAPFDGHELASRLYSAKFPAILCTKWAKAGAVQLRDVRRNIPVLLNPEDLEPETLRVGLVKCVRELDEGVFDETRLTRRTVVRVVEGPEYEHVREEAFVVVPNWDRNTVVRILTEKLDPEIQQHFVPGERLYARVNLGAIRLEDLFFADWEV